MSDDGSGNDGSQDAAPDNEGAAPKTPDSKRPLAIATLVAFALLLAALAAYLYLGRDIRADVWQEATVPYDESACDEEGECEVFATSAAGHGSHDPEDAIEFFYNPDIDDAIAQWGDCIGAVFVCIETNMQQAGEGGGEPDRASIINTCVAEAEDCPNECKAHFASQARGLDFDAMEALFFATFVEERGYCVPREADQ